MPLKLFGPGALIESAANEETLRRVYLTGFMGAGKSTVGALLAQLAGWRFFDLDAVIEERTGQTVSCIFETRGESHFRFLELETLTELHAAKNAVLSLGGGAVETEEVRSLIASDEHGAVIFLEAPLTQLMERCAAQDGGANRPLLRDVPLLQARYENRLAHYRKAHLTVATQDLSPEEVAARIMKYLTARKTWK